MRNIFLIGVLMSLVLVACKKSDVDRDDPLYLLTSRSWKLTKNDKNSASNPPGYYLYYPINQCEVDDIYTFGRNNKLTHARGTIKCSANETNPRIVDYTVDFANKKITVNGAESGLAEISATQLKICTLTPGTSGYLNFVFVFEPVK